MRGLQDRLRGTAREGGEIEFSVDDVVQLANTSAHVFRHTFGSPAIARDMPTDVVQPILGHASLQTTSIEGRATAHARGRGALLR